MAKSPIRTGVGGTGPTFLLLLALVIYAMFSIAVAVTTVKDCEKAGNDQHWEFFPPHWVCDAPTNVSPN